MIQFNKNTDKFRVEIQRFKNREMLRTGLKTASEIFDSSRIEPIPENRILILKTMYPIIFSYVKNIIQKSENYSVMCSDDVLQSATHGALVGIDYYISELEKGRKHTTKISVYAYNWMKKYALEQLNNGSQISLSRRTKKKETVVDIDGESFRIDKTRMDMLSIDNVNESTSTNDGDMYEAEISFSNINDGDKIEDINYYSNKLFGCLETNEKKILFLYFGISCAKEYTLLEIAKMLKMNPKTVSANFKNSINKLKETAINNNDFKQLLIDSKLLSNSNAWKI